MSQFGYGRRTCQGQTVTEADLIAGIGSIAWLFNISKEPRQEKARKIMMNEKASISMEELVTGLSDHSSDGGSDEDEIPLVIGAFPPLTAEERREQFWKQQQEMQKSREKQDQMEEDPTLNFSTLLIAKPLPFKFELTVRNDERRELVEALFSEKKAEGEFVESKQYWGEKSGQPGEFGWVKV